MKSVDDLRDFHLPDELRELRTPAIMDAEIDLCKEINSKSNTVIVALNDGVVLKIDGVKRWVYDGKAEMFLIHYEENKNFIIAKKEIKYIGDDENLRRFETE